MFASMPIGRAPNYTFSDTCVTKRTYIQILFLFLFFVKRVQIIQGLRTYQPMLAHLGIPLGRPAAAVSQQLLNGSNIHTRTR